MAVCSLTFLALCLAVVVVFHLVPNRLTRQVILSVATGLFLETQVPNERSAIFFACALLGTYASLRLVRATHHGAVVAAAIGLVLLVFLYLKRYGFFSSWVPVPMDWDLEVHPIELVGLSYILFKLIHMLVDEWQGQLAPFSLWSYLNYQLAFFTLTAGPIQRYNDFASSWNKMDEQPRDPREGVLLWTRLLLGLLKISILATWAHSIFVTASNVAEPHSLAHAVTCFYAYPAYLYFNFAGYTDVMIGIGGLLGFKLPENFNRPFLARNVLDFWDRWHISVTHWIRDYIFMTSYKSAATHFPGAARYWSYLLLFVALFLAGVWHGTTGGFVIFGALNGLGAAATRAYGDLLRARLGGPGFKVYLQNRTIRWIATLVTLHYVCFCMLFFALTPHEVQVLLTSAWHELVALPTTLGASTWRTLDAIPFVVAALALVALWKAETIGVALARLAAGISARPALLYSLLCTQTAIVVLVLYFDWAFQQEPPPVLYMSF